MNEWMNEWEREKRFEMARSSILFSTRKTMSPLHDCHEWIATLCASSVSSTGSFPPFWWSAFYCFDVHLDISVRIRWNEEFAVWSGEEEEWICSAMDAFRSVEHNRTSVWTCRGRRATSNSKEWNSPNCWSTLRCRTYHLEQRETSVRLHRKTKESIDVPNCW